MVCRATAFHRLEGYDFDCDEPRVFGGISFFPNAFGSEEAKQALGLTPDDMVVNVGHGTSGSIVSFRFSCESEENVEQKAEHFVRIIRSIVIFGQWELEQDAPDAAGTSKGPTGAAYETDLKRILDGRIPELLLPIATTESSADDRDSRLIYRLLSAVDTFADVTLLGPTPSSFILMRSAVESLIADGHVSTGPDFIAMGYAMAGVYENPAQALESERTYQRMKNDLATGSDISVDEGVYDACLRNAVKFIGYLGGLVRENGNLTMSGWLFEIDMWAQDHYIAVYQDEGRVSFWNHEEYDRGLTLLTYCKFALVILFAVSGIWALIDFHEALVVPIAVLFSLLCLMFFRGYWPSNCPLEFRELPWDYRVIAARGRDSAVGRNIMRCIEYDFSRYSARLTIISLLISMIVAVATILVPWKGSDTGSLVVSTLLLMAFIISIASVIYVSKDEMVQLGYRTGRILGSGYGYRYEALTDQKVETLLDDLNQLKAWINTLSASIWSSALILAVAVLIHLVFVL